MKINPRMVNIINIRTIFVADDMRVLYSFLSVISLVFVIPSSTVSVVGLCSVIIIYSDMLFYHESDRMEKFPIQPYHPEEYGYNSF